MENPDPLEPPERSSVRFYLLLAGVALLLAGGIVAVLLLGESTPPAPPSLPLPPPDPVEEPLPTSPAELLRDLSSATAAGNRARLVRLLSDDWAAFVIGADAEVRAVAEAKTKAVEAARTAVGEPAARLVRELPDLPSPWPLFVGVDWSKGKVVEKSLTVGELTFVTDYLPDRTVRLRPGSAEVLDETKADVAAALSPLKETYLQLVEQAKAGRFAADTFPDALNAIRLLAIAARPPAKPR